MKFFLGAYLALQAMASASAFSVVPSTSGASKTQLFAGTSPGYTSKTSKWEMDKISPNQRIEGETRHTWNFPDISREVVQVALKTEGRPCSADVELWIGPDWTPVKINSYSEDGKERPIQTLIGTRNKSANLEIRNTGGYEFPLTAAVSYAISPLADARKTLPQEGSRYIEGGAVYSHSFDPEVDQVQCLLKTDGRMLNAKIELLNGPNNVKQTLEVFTNNGELNSLFVVFETPGAGNTIRIRNLATLEFPCAASFKASETKKTLGTTMTWK
mmetsp:Transcript_32027/g.37342  ORF Transcript_32027/g.37342 Transcript_32027/m.37342 type:complete len:272 (+) Transcript_32027:120-935(+)